MGVIQKSDITAYASIKKDGIQFNVKKEGGGYTKSLISGYVGTLHDLNVRFKPANLEHEIPACYEYSMMLKDGDEVVAFSYTEGNGGARLLANMMAGGDFTAGCPVKVTHSLKTGNAYIVASHDKEADLPTLAHPWVDGVEVGVPEAPLTGETSSKGNPMRDYTKKNLFYRDLMIKSIKDIFDKDITLPSREEEATTRAEAVMTVLGAVKGRTKDSKLENFEEKAETQYDLFSFTFANPADQNILREKINAAHEALGGSGDLYPILEVTPSTGVDKADEQVGEQLVSDEEITF